MSRDGSGNYSLPQAAFTAGTTIESSKVNSNFSDIASALTASLAKDGQTTPTANLPMGSFKHTGVANATARTHYAAAGQIADNSMGYAADTGSADACVIAPAPGISAYAVGQRFTFKVAAANLTTTPTLAVNGLTAGIIKWADGSALVAGDLPLNALVEVVVATVTTGTPTYHLQTVSFATGTGAFVRAASPTLVTPALGTPSSGVLSNCTAETKAQATNSTALASTAYTDRVAVQQVVSTITGAVATGTTTIPNDDTTPQSGEGDQYMSLSITPKSATSKLVIEVTLWLSNTYGGGVFHFIAGLFQDSTADALAVGMAQCPAAALMTPVSFTHVMTSGTTSATTFKVRAGGEGGTSGNTTTFNGISGSRKLGGVMASSIVITEVGV